MGVFSAAASRPQVVALGEALLHEGAVAAELRRGRRRSRADHVMSMTSVRFASTPLTSTVSPKPSPLPLRISDTASTPGACAAARAASSVSGDAVADHARSRRRTACRPRRRTRSHALAEHGDERDQREPDHQRGRGRGGPARVPRRVLAGELAGGAADARAGRAEDGGERPTSRGATSVTPMKSSTAPTPERRAAAVGGRRPLAKTP